MDRRVFTQKLMQSVVSYALLDTLFAQQAFSKAIDPITKNWAIVLQEYCMDLKKDSISISEWRWLIQDLYRQIDLTEILAFIKFENLIKGFTYPDLGVNTKAVRFPKLAGLPKQTVFTKKIFGMKKDRAIIPHGHSNMVSAHLVLEGSMHLRHYDKLNIDRDRMIIQPTVDKMIQRGEASSISDDKDNVHWFIANSETAFTFDVIMLNLQEKAYEIHNLDIYEQEKQGNGSLSVPILDVETALKKYGKTSHH